MAKIHNLREENGYTGDKPYQVSYLIGDRRKRLHFASEAEAKSFVKMIEGEKEKMKHQGAVPDWYFSKAEGDTTVREIYDRYVRGKVERNGSKSARKATVKILSPMVNRFGDLKVSQLSPRLITDFEDEMAGKGRRATTVHTYVTRFRSMINWAVDKGYIGRNPLDGAKVDKGECKEKELLSDEEAGALIKAVESHPVQPYVFLGLATGMRLNEMYTLAWPSLKPKDDHWTVTIKRENAKNKFSARTFPVRGEAARLLGMLYPKRESDKAHVLWHPKSMNTIRSAIKRISEECLKRKTVLPHDLRVCFASRCLRGRRIKGEDGKWYRVAMSIRAVARYGGWEPNSPVLLSIYAKATEEELEDCSDLANHGLSVGDTTDFCDDVQTVAAQAFPPT